jgi:hypothetical protein
MQNRWNDQHHFEALCSIYVSVLRKGNVAKMIRVIVIHQHL